MSESGTAERAAALKADCANCAALCCVALAFAKSADFAFTKDAGEPCVNLLDDFRCGIHPELRDRGFKGCTVFDCFGAGQKVTQLTFADRDWRQSPQSSDAMFAVFRVTRQLHEMLWYLNDAMAAEPAYTLRGELGAMFEETEALTLGTADEILALDIEHHRTRVNALLARASELVRTAALHGRPRNTGGPRSLRPGADLIGVELAGQDLRGSNLRGAYLIAADLRRADFRGSDLIGADFRDADLRGANLSSTLFLTQFQLNAAKGDAATILPPTLERPSHWDR